MSIVYNPTAIFEQNFDKNGVCTCKSKVITLAGATNNQLGVTAVTGKSIFVLSGNLRSAGLTSAVTFKSASGGTNLYACQVPAIGDNPKNEKIEPQAWGAFHTNTAEGLYLDNTGADAVTVSLRYIEVVL